MNNDLSIRIKSFILEKQIRMNQILLQSKKEDLYKIQSSRAYKLWQVFNYFKRVIRKNSSINTLFNKSYIINPDLTYDEVASYDVLKIDRPHRKKRIAYFTNQLLDWNDRRPRYGGGERYCLTLSRLLCELGFEVDLYQIANTVFTGKYYEFQVKTLIQGDSYSEFNLGAVEEFYKISLEYDHVIYNLPELTAGSSIRKDALLICHGVWFDHDNYGPNYKFRSERWLSYLRKSFNNPMKIVSVDTNSINVIRSFFPNLANKMTYIPNFYDEKQFQHISSDKHGRNKQITILFPRRSHVNRGSRILSDILKLVRHDVKFFWVGEGDDADTQIILELCKQDHRLKYDKANFENMPKWYRKADITVIPTIACEGTSLSCIEALASGTATIATNVGGLPNIITDEYNGLLVDANAKSIATAINRLIEDHKLRKMLQRNGIKSSTLFSYEKWKQKWIKVLRDISWIQDSCALTPRVVILTKNAIHGGVETLVKIEADFLNADVIVTGGINDPEHTCPFEYTYIDDANTLLLSLLNYDVVLYHYIPNWALGTLKTSQLPSLEFVHRIDTSDCDKSVPTCVATHSDYIKKFLTNKYHLDNVVYVPNAANLKIIKRTERVDEKVYIGAITSYFKTKGIDVLIEAWSLLKPKFKKNYRLVLYGSGNEVNSFKELARKLSVSVEFRGPLKDPMVGYRDLYLYITASRIEGLPISVLEALSCNIPVIASNIDGHRAINEMAQKNGFDEPLILFESENPVALSKSIEDFLENPVKKNSRPFIDRCFSPKEHCEILSSCLNKIYRNSKSMEYR